MQKHDKADKYGFDVEPELLAHELTLLKLSKSKDLNFNNEYELYDAYTEIYNTFKTIIDDKTRYDSTYQENL